MDMDDDDFMGEIEFDLSPEQEKIVNRAISVAAESGDAFRSTNPLISILQWWQANVSDSDKIKGSPEEMLTDACRRFLLTHQSRDQPRDGEP
jgi:hypothetical protein